MSRWALGSLFQGLSRSRSKWLSSQWTVSAVHPSPRAIAEAHTVTAPPRIDNAPLGTTRSGSISGRDPRPLHDGQNPTGELNENDWGVSSPKEVPHDGHAFFSLKKRSSPLPTRATTMPSLSRNAASTESVR